ncbi:hypothetical protein C1646_757188 [Rhizophagus diaphanus]|nr:hypothetical protein C1646_757188 [Rhizophagus diaphanus] [Rhizophagus sp. MUCL 43196]
MVINKYRISKKSMFDLIIAKDVANIIDASWVPGAPILNTTYVPDGDNGPNYPEAFGHFTFGNDQVKHRFLRDPIFVNDHHCTYTSSDEKNPYISST